MLNFINSNHLWPIVIALISAFVSSVVSFRLATKSWYSAPTKVKFWVLVGSCNTALGAWFIYTLSSYTMGEFPTIATLTTALCVTGLVLATLVISALDLYLRSKNKLSTYSHADLSHMALVDTLTLLPNRRALMQQLEAAARRCERTGTSMALAFIDVDNFKHINDTHGHQAGDEVLQAVAKALVSAVRGCDEVARIGGDEFIALIEDIKSNEDCTAIVERMVTSIREISLQKLENSNITASIGVALFPRDGNVAQLMSAADTAMYHAKRDGKNQFRFFDADIAGASDQLLEIQHDLKHALANDELILHYQVKIDSITRNPVGAEALLRWEHPVKGLLHPADFMHAAERFGLSYEISDWVVEECCRTLHRLNYLHVPFNISINLSHQQMRNAYLVPEVLVMLKRFNLPTYSLMFELTETAAIKNQTLFSDLLGRFKTADLKIAIDDFGTQPSSLAQLQNLSINELKLDPIFIADIATNHISRGIVQAVVELAHVLDLNVVAEGVETEEQRRVVAELGCDQMQGFFIARPVPEEKLVRLLKKLSIHYETTGQFSIDGLKKL